MRAMLLASLALLSTVALPGTGEAQTPASAGEIRAQDTLFFPPADRLAVRVMRAVPAIDLVPGVHVHTVVGTTGSISFGEFDSGAVAPLHHHTREQADVGLAGVLDMTIGPRVEALGPGAGVIVPPNVEHSIANRRGGVMTVIEFHTVRRPDLVPPRPAMTFPSSPEPAPVPGGLALVAQIDGSAGTTLTGETCTTRWRRVTQTPIDLHPAATNAELFVFVVRGNADLIASGRTVTVSAGTLVIIPAGLRHVSARARDAGDVALVEFARRAR